MNKIVLLFFSLFASFACGRQNSESVVKVACEDKSFKDYIEKEYFVVYDTDTSSVSLVVTETTFIRMSVYVRLDSKRPFPNDCDIESHKRLHRATPFRVTSYSGMLDELKQCLEVASMSFNLSKAAYANFFLGDLGDVAVQTVSAMLMHGKNLDDCWYTDIDAALAKTSFTSDMNALFSRFGLKVKSAKCVEGVIGFPGEELRKKCVLPPNLVIPKEMLDGLILVEF